MTDLKTCPLCGGEALSFSYRQVKNVCCGDKTCPAYFMQSTAEEWNARPGEDAAFAVGIEAGLREAAWIADNYANGALQLAEGWTDDERSAWENGGIDHCWAIRDAILKLIEKGNDND